MTSMINFPIQTQGVELAQKSRAYWEGLGYTLKEGLGCTELEREKPPTSEELNTHIEGYKALFERPPK